MSVERLTFNLRRSRTAPLAAETARRPHNRRRSRVSDRIERARKVVSAARERYHADYIWMMVFTFLLFFRPQDQIPGIAVLHLSELTAIAGLAAMAARRLSAGQTLTTITPEVIGVTALGGVILATTPFSTWPGGSAQMFSEIYVKIILMFALMITTLSSPKRIRQITWLILIGSGYLAGRAIFDYVRGVNLVEGDRVRGAVGGMFSNPNDLALNLVAFLAPASFIVLEERKTSHRVFAAGLAVLMLGAIVCTKSRSGFLGLIAMSLTVAYYTARLNPAAVFAVLFSGLAMLPLAPSSFWNRMDSIMNAQEDETGSREARLRLLEQGIQVFLANPLTGVGAGQFQNYNMPGVTIEKWRVTHNVWLQVAAELGIFGLVVFVYLVYRAFHSNRAASRLLRGAGLGRRAPPPLSLTDVERTILTINARAMLAAMIGWTVCAMFASIAFNWTFYYLLTLSVAGREVAASRQTAAGPAHNEHPSARVGWRTIRARA
jgi:O-antigen ligase